MDFQTPPSHETIGITMNLIAPTILTLGPEEQRCWLGTSDWTATSALRDDAPDTPDTETIGITMNLIAPIILTLGTEEQRCWPGTSDWTATSALRDDAPDTPDTAQAVTINVVVHDCRFGDREAHLAGRIERGLHPEAPTTLTVPYDVAKQLFVANDQQAAMQAFMTGQIKVEADVTKVMAMSSITPTPEQLAYQQRIQELTA